MGSALILDVASGEVLNTYELAEPAYLSVSSTGRLVYLIQYEGDEVDVLHAGTWTEPHDDHFHHYVADPQLLEPISGPAPAHVVGHDGVTAVFTDGNGEVLLFDEGALEDGERDSEIVTTGQPHHGVGIYAEGEMVLTLPDPEAEDGALPYGLQVLDADGNVVAENADCPELHGEVGTWMGMAFACADGIQLVDPQGDETTFSKVDYPADADGLRVWSLVGDELSNVVFGALSGETTQRAIARVDLDAGTAVQIELQADTSSIALDANADSLFAVTGDGRLHMIDADTSKILDSVDAVDPFEYGGDGPTPELAVGDGYVYVSNPAAGSVVEVRFDDRLTVERTFDVGGAPQRLVAVGAY